MSKTIKDSLEQLKDIGMNGLSKERSNFIKEILIREKIAPIEMEAFVREQAINNIFGEIDVPANVLTEKAEEIAQLALSIADEIYEDEEVIPFAPSQLLRALTSVSEIQMLMEEVIKIDSEEETFGAIFSNGNDDLEAVICDKDGNEISIEEIARKLVKIDKEEEDYVNCVDPIDINSRRK